MAKQGEIWYVNLNPTRGSEQAGIRPFLILSGNLMNEYLNVVIGCPLTTKIKNYKGNLILHPNENNGLNEISEVMTMHIRSISKDRLSKKAGVVKNEELNYLIQCLNEILRY